MRRHIQTYDLIVRGSLLQARLKKIDRVSVFLLQQLLNLMLVSDDSMELDLAHQGVNEDMTTFIVHYLVWSLA